MDYNKALELDRLQFPPAPKGISEALTATTTIRCELPDRWNLSEPFPEWF